MVTVAQSELYNNSIQLMWEMRILTSSVLLFRPTQQTSELAVGVFPLYDCIFVKVTEVDILLSVRNRNSWRLQGSVPHPSAPHQEMCAGISWRTRAVPLSSLCSALAFLIPVFMKADTITGVDFNLKSLWIPLQILWYIFSRWIKTCNSKILNPLSRTHSLMTY